MKSPRRRLSVVFLAALFSSGAEVRKPSIDWPYYGQDPGGMRHSPASQITRENVARLRMAWTYRTGEAANQGRAAAKAALETTPILVDGTLFLSTPFNRVIALDPVTGAERWKYDPGVDLSAGYSEVTSRGVSAWLDPERDAGEPCRRRIFAGTIDARLIALDAATGLPCSDFGRNGQVDLTRDIRVFDRGDYQVTSPPAVVSGLVVVGSSVGDNRAAELERGVVRAFDARTGDLRWSWDPIPQSPEDPERESWAGDSATRTGAANAWSVISVDPARGLVFVPTSSPSPDFYGGERKGSNRYANSVVALRAESGKMLWQFQVVHHDLWDYDVAAQPVLIELKRDGRALAAVAVATKMGHVFVLDRETGKPLLPVEERPVPSSDVPGEEAWPTQPFPSLPPALVPQKLTADDAWGLTQADRDWCRDRLSSLRSEGIFTPPSLRGTVVFPGNVGGVNWGGAAFDPVRGVLVASTNRVATVVRLIPRAEFDRVQSSGESSRIGGEFGRQAGTPYAMHRETLLAPSGVPCNAPPWGALTAVDVATGRIRWEVPLGSMPALRNAPGSSKSGSLNLGGAITTAGGLVFIAASVDPHLRAFDIETGRELWKGELPASGMSTPMSYEMDGRQYVVIAAGGHGKARGVGVKMGDHVAAFALP
jgi:quinoprotein glucose dehydrogenase